MPGPNAALNPTKTGRTRKEYAGCNLIILETSPHFCFFFWSLAQRRGNSCISRRSGTCRQGRRASVGWTRTRWYLKSMLYFSWKESSPLPPHPQLGLCWPFRTSQNLHVHWRMVPFPPGPCSPHVGHCAQGPHSVSLSTSLGRDFLATFLHTDSA